jgi:hypothetical protein
MDDKIGVVDSRLGEFFSIGAACQRAQGKPQDEGEEKKGVHGLFFSIFCRS